MLEAEAGSAVTTLIARLTGEERVPAGVARAPLPGEALRCIICLFEPGVGKERGRVCVRRELADAGLTVGKPISLPRLRSRRGSECEGAPVRGVEFQRLEVAINCRCFCVRCFIFGCREEAV